MIDTHHPSLGLKRGLRFSVFSSVEELDKAAGVVGTALSFANQFLISGHAGARARDTFTTALESASGFPWKMEVVEKDGEKVEVAAWSEPEYVNAFRAAIESGAFKTPFCNPGNLEAKLQELADSLAPIVVTATDLRKARGVKTPAKMYIDRATVIFNNQNEKSWLAKFQERGITIAAFTGKREDDIVALANGLKAYMEQEAERVFV